MKVILLAAGFGTRLRPLTDNIPKCLVPIKGKPLLQIWLERLAGFGLNQFLINTHYLSQQVAEFINNSKFKNNCIIKQIGLKKLNTLCTNISSTIGYYNIARVLTSDDNNISIIYNIDITKLTSYYPIFYNPIYIKNVYTDRIINGINMYQFHSNSWNRVINAVCNTYSKISYDKFPLNSILFPNIQQYIKTIKYTKNT